MHECERKRESVGSSRTCLRPRRRHCGREQRGEASAVGWVVGGVLEQHVVRRGATRGQQRLGTWPARAAGRRREKNRERGLEVDEGGPSCNFPKVQELHCKA
ncbi:hypothetical protein GQ55_6G148300 [Panicum hallii var. hallii]|uniref:Uncharacterized protein n=1 Tax=Panicum hallii var. hallii TaxID=1504633 RepID=A0A2T7D699_9POAL|nr:hypothetical protein GQ55_6G148300 [Panicum hallii var. hallii]